MVLVMAMDMETEFDIETGKEMAKRAGERLKYGERGRHTVENTKTPHEQRSHRISDATVPMRSVVWRARGYGQCCQVINIFGWRVFGWWVLTQQWNQIENKPSMLQPCRNEVFSPSSRRERMTRKLPLSGANLVSSTLCAASSSSSSGLYLPPGSVQVGNTPPSSSQMPSWNKTRPSSRVMWKAMTRTTRCGWPLPDGTILEVPCSTLWIKSAMAEAGETHLPCASKKG